MNSKPFRQTDAQKRFAALASSGVTRVMAFGGSRSGKTFEIIREIAKIAFVVGGRHAVFRKTFNAVKTAIFEDTAPKVFKLCFPGMVYEVNRTDCVYKIPSTGGEIWFLGLDDKERVEKVLGKEFATVYFNESSDIAYASVEIVLTRLSQKVAGLARNVAFFDCNPPSKSHWTYKLFVEKRHPVANTPLANPEKYAAMRMNPTDNIENIGAGYIEETLGALTAKNRQRFLLGEFTDDNENALWRSSMIAPFRLDAPPGALDRIVIGVDPAVTSTDESDSTGVIVAGRAGNGDDASFYVLEDATLRASPERWARAVASAFDRWEADKVVAEVNNGGDLVIETLRRAAPNLPVSAVRATRGKLIRAEPVAALYERGKVHHCGTFEELETEMTSFVGDVSEKSPDRLDALVWALTELSAPQARARGGVFYFG